jgi:mRNA interferase MazF
VRRGEIYWASLPPPAGRRPVLVVTRDAVIPFLTKVTVAPVTRTVRGIRSEVPVGPAEGLSSESVANCDNLETVPKAALETAPVGLLPPGNVRRLDQALRFALGIRS